MRAPAFHSASNFKGIKMDSTHKFSFRFYFHALSKMLGEPRHFFSELPVDLGFKKPLGFLIVSSIFFTGASVVSSMPSNPIYLGASFLSTRWAWP